jgi:hypothetical protein
LAEGGGILKQPVENEEEFLEEIAWQRSRKWYRLAFGETGRANVTWNSILLERIGYY